MRKSLLFSTVLAIGCTSAPTGGPNGTAAGDAQRLTFHGEAPALNLAHDTGWLPAGSPIQVRLQLSAAGTVSVDAAAESDMKPVPASGKLVTKLVIKAQALMKIDVPGVKTYEGPLMGVPSIDLDLGGETQFDPFLLDGQEAAVDLRIPPGDLPPIPLAGAVPIPGVSGNLIIKVAKADLQSVFRGSCAGAGHYAGTVGARGKLTLEPRIELKVGSFINKTVAPFQIDVPIPEVRAPLALATTPASSASGAGCNAGPDGAGGGGGNGGGGSGGVDGGALTGDGGALPAADGGTVGQPGGGGTATNLSCDAALDCVVACGAVSGACVNDCIGRTRASSASLLIATTACAQKAAAGVCSGACGTYASCASCLWGEAGNPCYDEYAACHFDY